MIFGDFIHFHLENAQYFGQRIDIGDLGNADDRDRTIGQHGCRNQCHCRVLGTGYGNFTFQKVTAFNLHDFMHDCFPF